MDGNAKNTGSKRWFWGPIGLFVLLSSCVGETAEDGTASLGLLRGVVRDGGRPLPGATVQIGSSLGTTGADGAFELPDVAPGQVEVSRPGWQPATITWDGSEESLAIELHPLVVRALYAGAAARWDRLLGLAERTEIDALVVDVKDSSGHVFYDSQVGLAREIGAIRVAYDVSRVLDDLSERGIRPIARLVSFEDPVAATHAPSLAVQDSATGRPWKNNAGIAWLDPTDPGAHVYLLDLAAEACAMGFEEVQFDYVRFPTDGPVGRAVYDGAHDRAGRVAAIASFLSEAKARLHPMGCAVAADVFGIVTTVRDDSGIGQKLEELARAADVLCPMVYPSHYSTGWFGLSSPNAHPGEVIAASMDDALERLDTPVVIRPWLQAFSLGSPPYGPTEVRAQIDAAEERDLGWILWNAAASYDERALHAAEEQAP